MKNDREEEANWTENMGSEQWAREEGGAHEMSGIDGGCNKELDHRGRGRKKEKKCRMIRLKPSTGKMYQLVKGGKRPKWLGEEPGPEG